MSSALKPVLTPGGPQNSSVPSQMNKPMHPQGPPTSYGQPPPHVPQNLVNIPHNAPNSAHNPTNVHHTTQNHYSLNVPSAQHYGVSGTIPASSHPMPISNHPVPVNQAHAQPISYNASPPKNPSYPPTYQPNLGHPPNVNLIQNLAAVQPQQAAMPLDSLERPQSNGTPELKPAKPEQNHISPPRDRAPPQSPEKAKLSPKKPSSPIPTSSEEASDDYNKQEQNVSEPSESNSSNASLTMEAPMDATTSITSTQSSNEVIPAVSSENVSLMDTETDNQMPTEEDKPELPPVPTIEPNVPSKPKEQATPKSTMRLATTPRTPSRKSKTPKLDISESPRTSKSDKAVMQKSPGSIKRTRTRTQPYQSPLPEFEIISKMSSSNTPRSKSGDDKLIIFYKNEFLAVRNLESGFYICQAVQNIYKSSPKIRIRWLSLDKTDKSGEIYAPDFYDHTDFDCILTNLNLERVYKGKFRLPPAEKDRTDSILKRALAVEKGDATPPSLTEEHPDGLDLSLYKEESQLQKRKGKKRKSSSPLKAESRPSIVKKTPDQPKVKKIVAKVKSKVPPVVRKVVAKKSPVEVKKTTHVATGSRSERAKRRQEITGIVKTSPVVDQKKAKVLAKVARKTAIPVPKMQTSSSRSSIKLSKSPPAAPPSRHYKPTQKNQAAATRKTKRTRK